MGTQMNKRGFRIRPITVNEHGYSYRSFQLVGYVAGARVRKRFLKREDAIAEKNLLEIHAANRGGEIQAVNTRLSHEQIAEAESAIRRLNGKSLSEAVEWYLKNYRPPCVPMPLDKAIAAFKAVKQQEVEPVHYNDVKRKLRILEGWFPAMDVAAVRGDDVEAKMVARNWAPKTWNNVRGCFHDFFEFCVHERRRWVVANPISELPSRKVARGLPLIETSARLAEMFNYLETHTGGSRRQHKPGFLVPYFALATFAGLRPSVPGGEIWKIGHLSAPSKVIDTDVGVIRISPEIAKTDCVRQIKIRPNLAAWLMRYPIAEFPIVMPNLSALVTEVRKKFELTDDVLRHTWLSMHVAAFRSLGEAALEAGNSEAIIKLHYLNMVTEASAAQFWSIVPQSSQR
jgi:hypothetical protein